MKVARYMEANGPLQIMDESEPQLAAGEILIKVIEAGICSTDAKIVMGKRTIKAGIVLGHEIAGIIVDISSDIKAFVPGDRVGIFPGLSCQTCYYCQKGLTNICESKISLGLQIDGGFQQYMKVPSSIVSYGNVVKLPSTINFREATLLEPISCCLQSHEIVNVHSGDNVLIAGAGSMGLLHLIIFQSIGVRKIIVSDPLKDRRELALELGASRVIDSPNEDVVKISHEETNGIGVDVCYLCADDPVVIGQLCDAVRKRGAVNIFSSSIKNLGAVIDPNTLHYKEIFLTGSHSSSLEHYNRSFAYFDTCRVQLNKIITQVFSIKEINQAMQMYITNKALKALIQPNE